MFDDRAIFARRVLAAAGLAAGLLVGLGATAQAQIFGWWDAPTGPAVRQSVMLSAGQIYRIVAARGYQATGGLRRNGRVYVVDVVDRWGRPLRLVVDAYEGDILQRFATRPPRPAASIPRSQSDASLLPQFPFYSRPPAYPAYPDSANPGSSPPAATLHEAPRADHRSGHEARHEPRRKTRTAKRETGHSERPGHPGPAEVAPSHVRGTARTELAPPRPAAEVVAPPRDKPAATVGPAKAATTPAKHENVTAAAVAQPIKVSAKPARPAAPAKAVQRNTQGPGYANGVPINPLD